MVICQVLSPWTLRRPDGSLASAGERIILPDRRARRLAEQQVVAVIEHVGG